MPSNDERTKGEPNVAGRLLGTHSVAKSVEDLEAQIKQLAKNVGKINHAFQGVGASMGSGFGSKPSNFPTANAPYAAGQSQAGGAGPNAPGSGEQQAAQIMQQRMGARRASQNERTTQAADERRRREDETRRQREQAHRDRTEANQRRADEAQRQQQAMRDAQEQARRARDESNARARAALTMRVGGAGGIPPRPTYRPTAGTPSGGGGSTSLLGGGWAVPGGSGGGGGDNPRLSYGMGQAAGKAVSWGAGKFTARTDHMRDQANEMDRYAAFAYSNWGDTDKGYWSQKNKLRNDAMHSSTALSTEDLNTGLFEVDKRLGMGRGMAERRTLHKQASGYALLDPSMGVADSARMMTSMYTPQASMQYQVMGMGSTIGAGGSRMSQSQLNSNVLDQVFRKGYSSKNVQAASEQGGSLRVTLEGQARQMGQDQEWVEQRLSQLQSQSRWQEKTGGTNAQYDKLLQDAGGTGDLAQEARKKLQDGGLDVDNLVNQSKRKEGEERRHDSQMMDAFAPALQKTTDVVIDFKEALNSILELPGLKHVVGGAQGINAGTGGRAMSTLSGAGTGALMGAGIGSVVPGIGTGIGAVAGGVIGGVAGLIGGGAEGGGGSIGGGASKGSGNPKTRANLNQGSANSAIRAAMTQIGVDYSWGGGGPKGPSRGFAQGAKTVGFDCSSLMQYAYSKVGVKIGRTTQQQLTEGKGVSFKDRRPGDLMFPNSGHVVMYLGNGKIVHAPRTGQKIRVDPEDHFGKYIAVRRLVAGGGDTFATDEDGSTSSEAGAGNDNSAKTGADTMGSVTNAYGSVNEVDAIAAALGAGGQGPAGSGASAKSRDSGDESLVGADVDTGKYNWGAIKGRYTKVPAPPGWVKAAIQRGMAAKSVSGAEWARGLATIAYRESGYRKDARNDWDSNAKNGDPSVGLFQVIGSTFKSYRAKSLPNSQSDPAASAAAAIGWIKAKYGGIGKVQQANPNKPPKGYAVGAWDLPGNEIAQVHKGEMIVPARTAQTIRNALLQESIPVRSTSNDVVQGPKRGATGSGAVSIQFAQGAISVIVQGAANKSSAALAGRQIVDAIAADKRIKEIGAGS
ncbi:NlpC/P60 family protein [Streptomyces sp. H27-C3]|uniref:NlpC/P60 family protein n=1 Tax=Streptomyces sp. H27-C3 TaxID=3046305 RepID=UPI0024BAB23D|nr:NlpC/P60 family protein [Streptomyces sp. H27-C3]MDJ0463141.1 NlpC/P60 family protein [Streptomyces sp. H27-C3]